MIITIGRQCGSEGHAVGALLADHYQIPLFDKEALIEIAKERNIYDKMPVFFAETPVSSLMSAISEEEAEEQVREEPLKALAEMIGTRSCVIIGRCANVVFQDRTDACRVFLHGSKGARIGRIMESERVSRRKAEQRIDKRDEERAAFQRYYTGQTWGNAANYDICLDSCKLGAEGTAAFIINYIEYLEKNKG